MSSYSLIIRTATAIMVPLLLLFSISLLIRGHDEPGGGFIAGLVASSAFSMYLFAFDADSTKKFLKVNSRILMGVGLLLAMIAGFIALAFGQEFLTAQWLYIALGNLGTLKLSTPLLFDIGVYLVVLGTVTTIIIALAKSEDA